MNFYKICNYFNFNLVLSSVVVNILIVLLSVILTYFLIKRIFNIRVATISSYLFIIITPFYTYSPIFYTDTLTMIFLPLSFLLFHIYIKNTENMLLPIFIGILLAFGVGIKTNIIIGFISLLIFAIFIFYSTKNFFKFISICLMSFLIFSVLISSTCQKYIPIPLKDAGLPPTHWIMMGLKDNGGFNISDVKLSKNSGKTKKEIQEFNIRTIKTRLKNYGIGGYNKFLYKKIQYTWGDGTYFAPVKLSRKPIRPNFLHTYIYGDKNNLFTSFSEASHSLLLFLILIGSIGLFKSKNKIGFLFNICIFGVFLFLILWEARSRYLVCILPILVCSSSIGINEILKLKLFSNKKRRLEAK
ncbi:glycosyltransferase family 39 protein [Clostridium thermobutyricum]|uniref:glycosyltransferase family 39 protein n=1 Tax=Clostridium thermobutyricum TaxID=29372 RepID=UPI003F51BE30